MLSPFQPAGNPYKDLYGKLTGGSARNGDPFRLQVHEKGGMLLVLKYMEGKKILSYRFVKRPEGLSETFYGCEKVVKSFWFYYLFTFQRK